MLAHIGDTAARFFSPAGLGTERGRPRTLSRLPPSLSRGHWFLGVPRSVCERGTFSGRLPSRTTVPYGGTKSPTLQRRGWAARHSILRSDALPTLFTY